MLKLPAGSRLTHDTVDTPSEALRSRSAHAPARPAQKEADASAQSAQSLDSQTRGFMEARFAHDFSTVRIHTNADAARSAKQLGAAAFTVGQDIAFGTGRYGPRSAAGLRLLAHELAHTVQQSGASSASERQAGDRPGASQETEREAVEAASAALYDAPSSPGAPDLAGSHRPPVSIRRLGRVQLALQPESDEEKIRRSLGLTSPGTSAKPPMVWLGRTPAQFRNPSAKPILWLGQSPNAPFNTDIDQAMSAPRKRLEPMSSLLPPPRTPFEAKAFRLNMKRVRDPKTNMIIGFFSEESGVYKVYDINGRATVVGEKPLESPAIDPIDLIPFELIGTLAKEAAVTLGKGVLTTLGKTAIKESGVEGAELATKFAAEAAANAEKRALRQAGAGASEAVDTAKAAKPSTSELPLNVQTPKAPDITPPSRQLPPHVAKPVTADFAKNVASHGERVVERDVLDNFLTKARQLSAKAAGFDAVEGEKIAYATTTTARDGTIIVEEHIKGGTWYQIKGVSEARADLITDNVDAAMERAANGIKFARQNAFERTGPGVAYRSVYAGNPDQITIFLKLEKGTVSKDLVEAAEEAIKTSVHASDLPPVRFIIAGH